MALPHYHPYGDAHHVLGSKNFSSDQTNAVALRVQKIPVTSGVEMPQDAKRGPDYRRQLRKRLISQLGGHCARCGATDPLQFDVIKPTGWKSHGAGAINRYYHYKREARKGNVQLLCPWCHRLKTREDRKKALLLQKEIVQLPY